jgi:SH3-like domain-containing protein
VRDSSGEFSWIQKSALGDRRTLVSLSDATLHAAADDHSPAVLRLAPGVLVDLLEPPSNGYAHVRHRDGASGWIKISEVWGL